MGDMLQDGGNPWRGMIYGMTARHPWSWVSPLPVWKIWDEFGIADATMKGYWKKDCPVHTSHPDIYATAYVKKGKTLISVASWADQVVQVRLIIDWKAIGIDENKASLIAPEIKDFQEARTFRPTEAIPVEPLKGWLVYVKE